MPTSFLASCFTPQFGLSLAIGLIANVAIISTWKAGTDYEIAALKLARAVAIEDHDTLTTMAADVITIKRVLDKIEKRLDNRKDLANGE